MENLQLDELKMIKLGLELVEREELHVARPKVHTRLLEMVNKAIADDEFETQQKRMAEADDADRSELEDYSDIGD